MSKLSRTVVIDDFANASRMLFMVALVSIAFQGFEQTRMDTASGLPAMPMIGMLPERADLCSFDGTRNGSMSGSARMIGTSMSTDAGWRIHRSQVVMPNTQTTVSTYRSGASTTYLSSGDAMSRSANHTMTA